MAENWEKYREKIIGLGENSARKSYYPELQDKIKELEASQANLTTIINSTSDSIVIHNLKGKILSLNKQAEELFNFKDQNIEQFSISDITSDSLNPDDLHEVWNEVMENHPKIIEWLVKPIKCTTDIPVQVSLNRTNWYGQTAIVAVVRDFSERKKYENELINARRKAEDSDKLKSVFLANLSHEIRTPMNAIVGFADLLKDQSLPSEKREEFLEIIQKSGNHLLSIINDIVEISKIETNQVSPNLKQVNINTLLHDLYNIFSIISKESNVSLRLNIPESDTEIITDEIKLRQILTNLLTNAFKFTPKGLVEFGYKINDMLEFYVSDTGIGIKQENFGIIFDRFRQIENELSYQKGGSGLGLAICKAYTEMLGGNIYIQSEPGKGSQFWFTIPLNAAHTKTKSEQNQEEVIENRCYAVILIAEDDDNNYLLMSETLGKGNFNLLRAVNGKEAVTMVSENKNISMVLMDIKMPVMNGYEAFKAIRQISPHLPVIAQTAYALPEDEDLITSQGFNGYITKPVSRDKLFRIISQFL